MGKKLICKWYYICPMKTFFEEGKLDKTWIDAYCKGNYSQCVRRKMKEEGRYHPDNMLPDGTINKKLEI